MAQKKITDLQLRDNVEGTVNFAVDDTIQSYRVTASQIKDFILANGNILRQMITEAERVPIGVVNAFAGSSAPTGYLMCDGSAISRTTYADLFAVIGESHGEGDGSTTFNLPDYRGRFLRGVNDSTGRDPDAAGRTAMNTGGNTADNVGSIQGHAFQTHTHTQNAHTHNYTKGSVDGSGASNTVMGANFGGTPTSYTGAIANATATNQNATATGTHSQATANETRPVNAAVNFIIKY